MNTTSPLQAAPQIVRALVGSQAHGLAGPGSDRDWFAVAVLPSRWFTGLRLPDQGSLTYHRAVLGQDDITIYDVGKFARLAIKGNPSVLEALFLPTDAYTVLTDHGRALVEARSAFLSARAVESAYLGYLTAQAHKARQGKPETRTAKYGRHIYRLSLQAVQLWTTGALTVALSPQQAAQAREFGDRVAAGDTEAAFGRAQWVRDRLTGPSALPARPDLGVVDDLVVAARATVEDELP